MICKNCGKENNMINEFCDGCGVKLHKQETNPTKVYEIIVKVVNCILVIPFCLSIFLVLYLFLSTFLIGLGAATSGSDIDINNYFNSGIGAILTLITVSFAVMLVFNIIMGVIMRRKNKENISVSNFKKVKKITYVLLAYFLGTYGIHRFIIGDNKGGVTRLIINIGGPIFISFIHSIFPWAFFLILVPMIIGNGLNISDFVIGLSKVSDENKMIEL